MIEKNLSGSYNSVNISAPHNRTHVLDSSVFCCKNSEAELDRIEGKIDYSAILVRDMTLPPL